MLLRVVSQTLCCLLWLALTAEGAEMTWQLENRYLNRTVSLAGKKIQTTELVNKLAKRKSSVSGEEFRLRLSAGVDSKLNDLWLSAADFEVMASEGNAELVQVQLRHLPSGLKVLVKYSLAKDKSYGHKQLTIESERPQMLELVDIESVQLDDAYEPYQAPVLMQAWGRFLPALGQPLYTSKSAMYWGVEFPAAWNRVENNTLRCGCQYGVELKPGEPFVTHRAVFGVGDDPEFVQDAFLAYIEEIRFAPATLSVQYNSWFDFGGGVSQKKILESLDTLQRELVEKRHCRPLDVYVIDDGWQNSRPPRSPLADWSTGLYPVNDLGFEQNLQAVRRTIEDGGSKMGLWASPNCLFGATANIDVLEKHGFETLVGLPHPKSGKVKKAMSMAGPKYMALLEKRLLELVDAGSVYFKLDGIYGDMQSHLFETKAGRGTPVMTSLLTDEGMPANDPRLDDPKYDEMKRYYLTISTQRLAAIFDKMHRKNAAVRITCHNAATISPWWLMHLDVLSLVNCNDGAPGDRAMQMCYRDGLYYQLTRRDGNQVPLNSFFNHEPAKDGNRFDDATPEEFKNYFFMALSRGTLMVELYFVVNTLDEKDFDVVADGLKWLQRASPAFKRSRMHGGSPIGSTQVVKDQLSLKRFNPVEEAEVYGYTGWSESQGYVSIHNPTKMAKPYSFKLDRRFGLLPNSGPYHLTITHGTSAGNLKKTWNFGDMVTLNVQPHEVLILDFQRNNPLDK